MSECDIWIDGDVVFGAIAAAGAAFAYILYTTLTMGTGPLMGGRRKRRQSNESNHWFDVFWWGKRNEP